MKKLASSVILLVLCICRASFAVEYGDLYNIEWCPCNSEERYGPNGSPVMGKTVMCPCDSQYDGGRTFEKDIRKLRQKKDQTIARAQNYTYYVGFDYNKSHLTYAHDDLNFAQDGFLGVSNISVPVDQALDAQDNISIVIGMRPHKNLGIEAFYGRSYNKNRITRVVRGNTGAKDYSSVENFVSKYQAFGVDLLGYLPVTDYFDFIAFVGLGQYKFDNDATFDITYADNSASGSYSEDFSEDKLAWRVGGGLQFNIARGIILRSMYRYIKINSSTINYLQEFSVGVRFLF